MRRRRAVLTGRRTRPPAAALLLLGGAFIGFILLESALRIGGWAYLRHVKAGGPVDGADVIRVLCLGESTTALGGERSYPKQLERILNSKGSPARFRVINGGIPGVDTDGILDILPEYLLEYRPHLVVAMMGINDHCESRSSSHLSDLARSLRVWKLARLLWSRIVGANTMAILPITAGADQKRLDVGNNRAPKAPPAEIEADYERAKGLAARGDTEAAIRIYSDILLARPDFRKAYDRLLIIYRDTGRDAEAVALKQRRYRVAGGPAAGLAAPAGPRYPDPAVQEQLAAAVAFLNSDSGLNYDRATEALAEAPVHPGVVVDLSQLREIARLAERRVLPYRLERVLGALGMLCLRAGEEEAAEEFLIAAEERRLRVLNPITAANYERLCQYLADRGIPLVAVGYPMRGIAPLGRLLGHWKDSVTIVDNGALFRDTLRREPVLAVFDDLFGGDFGHCSPRGNEILAGHVAEAVARVAAQKGTDLFSQRK